VWAYIIIVLTLLQARLYLSTLIMCGDSTRNLFSYYAYSSVVK